jgi:hypothetical protein
MRKVYYVIITKYVLKNRCQLCISNLCQFYTQSDNTNCNTVFIFLLCTSLFGLINKFLVLWVIDTTDTTN